MDLSSKPDRIAGPCLVLATPARLKCPRPALLTSRTGSAEDGGTSRAASGSGSRSGAPRRVEEVEDPGVQDNLRLPRKSLTRAKARVTVAKGGRNELVKNECSRYEAL